MKWHRIVFENICLKSWGAHYQSFFESIMKNKHSDFVVIKPSGRMGDWKCDGFSQSDRIVYQVYAPLVSGGKKAVNKMETDFYEAIKKWNPKKWIFVYGVFGFPPTIYAKTRELQQKSGVVVETVSNEFLWNIIKDLEPDERNRLLGVTETPQSKAIELLEEIRNLLEVQQRKSRVSTRFAHLNVVLNRSESEPRVIRTKGANLVDFSNEYPVWRFKENQEIVDSLKLGEQDIRFAHTMLSGNSASGKTTLMLYIGCKLSQIGWNVYYAEAADLVDYDQQTVDIFAHPNSDTLLLVDTVNVNPKYAKHIISGFNQLNFEGDYTSRIRLLLTTSVTGPLDDPYWKDLQHVLESGPEITIDVDVSLITELVNKLQTLENVSVPISPERIIESYGADLSLIAEVISQWRDGRTDINNDLSLQAIERRTRELRAIDKKTGQMGLLIISIFTKMSCMVTSQFVIKFLQKIEYPRASEVIQQLIDNGHLITEKRGSDILLAISNPSVSSLLLQHFGNNLRIALEIGLEMENLNMEEYLIQRYGEENPPDNERFNLYKYAYYIENGILDTIEPGTGYFELISSGLESISEPYIPKEYDLPKELKKQGRQSLARASKKITNHEKNQSAIDSAESKNLESNSN